MQLYPHFTVRTLPSSKLLQRKPSEDNLSTVGPSLRLLPSYGHLSITETLFGSGKKKKNYMDFNTGLFRRPTKVVCMEFN